MGNNKPKLTAFIQNQESKREWEFQSKTAVLPDEKVRGRQS